MKLFFRVFATKKDGKSVLIAESSNPYTGTQMSRLRHNIVKNSEDFDDNTKLTREYPDGNTHYRILEIGTRYVLVDSKMNTGILCKRCGMVSFNENDVSQKYCGHCKIFLNN